MQVVFMGTPEFAVPSLEALLNLSQQCKVVGVMTQPDRPAGRGQRLTAPPVRLLADRHDVPVFQADRLRGNLDRGAAIGDATACAKLSNASGRKPRAEKARSIRTPRSGAERKAARFSR